MKVFNGHSDIFTALHYERLKGNNKAFKDDFLNNFISGEVIGSIFVLWTDEAHVNVREAWIEDMLKTVSFVFEENASIIKQVKSMKDYEIGQREKKINILLGMEGLAHIGRNIDLIEKYYYENGLRHASLTWNEENDLAKGPKFSGGLTKYGKEAVKKMQELGIIVDVSHLNDDGIWEMLKITKGPIMASHSNARALANVKRNLTDEQIVEIAKTGGIIGLNAAGDFISDKKEERNLEGLVNQLEYLINKAGIDHITFGFDFMAFLPEEAMGTMKPEPGVSPTIFGLEDESEIQNFIKLIKKRGYSQEDLEKISYKNYEEFLKKIIN